MEEALFSEEEIEILRRLRHEEEEILE